MTIKYLKEMPGIDAPAGYRYVLVKVDGVSYGSGSERFGYRGITVRKEKQFSPGHDITEWVNSLPKHDPDHNLQYIDDQDVLGRFVETI
jgi:hypothetical protein